MLRMVQQHLPGNASVMGTLASALRANQEFDAAWKQVHRARQLRPDAEWLHAIACRIAIARGDLDAANQALCEAQKHNLNDLLTLLARTELAIVERSKDASELVAECQTRALAEPRRNNGPDAEQLAQLLASHANN